MELHILNGRIVCYVSYISIMLLPPRPPKNQNKQTKKLSFALRKNCLEAGMRSCSQWPETPLCREYYTEKCVMNNYFGIGLDAKISLDFNNKRDEHPEKCRWVPAPRTPGARLFVSPSGRGVISGAHRALRQSTDTEPERLVRKRGASVCRGHGSGISMSPSGGVGACSPARPSSRQMPQERPRGGFAGGVQVLP